MVVVVDAKSQHSMTAGLLKHFSSFLSHVSVFSTIVNPYPGSRVLFVELVFEVHSHFAEKSVCETSSVANLKTLIGCVHISAVSE